MKKKDAQKYLGYCYDLSDHVVVYELADAKYMNHSFSPNVIDDPQSNDNFAAENIQKGQEMVEDYSSHDINHHSFRVELDKKYCIWQAAVDS